MQSKKNQGIIQVKENFVDSMREFLHGEDVQSLPVPGPPQDILHNSPYAAKYGAQCPLYCREDLERSSFRVDGV